MGIGGITMNWIQGLVKAIQYIESNLTHEITVNDVANHVYASNAHYQRVFLWQPASPSATISGIGV